MGKIRRTKSLYFIASVVLLFFIKPILAQNNFSDSLQYLSYNHLEEKISNTLSDSLKKVYSQVYLVKAKKSGDTIRIADSFCLMSEAHSHTQLGVAYADSIILYTENTSHYKYPAEGYLQKGIQLYYNSRYEEALDSFIKTEKAAKDKNNIPQQISVKHYIGLLKNVNNEKEEALNYFRGNLKFIEENNVQLGNEKLYFKTLFALADSYNRNQLIDSAEIICRRGLRESVSSKDKYLYPQFLMSYGVTSAFKGEWDVALDSLLKGSSLLVNEKRQLCESYIIISGVYRVKKLNIQSVRYLTKVDSIYSIHQEVLYVAKRAYEFLLTHYRDNDDVYNQIEILEKLILVNNVIKNTEGDLSKNIVKKYETPLLIEEKEELIKKLKEKEGFNKMIKISFYLLTVIMLFIIYYYYRRTKLNERRFNALMEDYNSKGNLLKIEKRGLEEAKPFLGLSEKLVSDTLNRLEEFEKFAQFTRQDYTLSKLAKELKTNSSYLSKIINVTKSQNFSTYLNNLRIDYAIDQLSKNKKLRLYTIQAIAEEVGFRNAQSFSTAFYRKTGIYPSFFVKQLKRQKMSISD